MTKSKTKKETREANEKVRVLNLNITKKLKRLAAVLKVNRLYNHLKSKITLTSLHESKRAKRPSVINN